jgi:outer membrane protein TolC
MYFIRGNLNLYRGGRDSLVEKSREATKRIFGVQSQQIIQQELLEVRSYFWDLVMLREIKGLLNYAIKQNQVNFDRANKRVNAGLSTRVDRLEFEISGTQLAQDLARVEVEISNNQRKISALIGKDPETHYETILEVPHDHHDPTADQRMDFNLYRDVQLELTNKTSLEFDGEIFKRWWTPSLDLYAESILYNFRERSFTAQRDQMDTALGIKISFEFDGFQQKRDGEALQARSRASELRAAQIKAETEAEFNTARQELVLLHDLIHEGEKNVQKGSEYLEVTLSEYSRGIKNSPDVLSAMLKNLEFKRRFAELRRDYAVVKAQLQSMLAKDL